MTTVRQFVEEIISSGKGFEGMSEKIGSIENIIQYAYSLGRETATREVSDRYSEHMRKQSERAAAHRYHKMIADVLDNGKGFIYNHGYDMEVTVTFGDCVVDTDSLPGWGCEVTTEDSETVHETAAEEVQESRNVVIYSFGSYNDRRYSMPWLATVKNGEYDFSATIGTYTGARSGDAGDLVVYKPQTGVVYAYGRKDYRKQSGTMRMFAIWDGEKFVECDKLGRIKK